MPPPPRCNANTLQSHRIQSQVHVAPHRSSWLPSTSVAQKPLLHKLHRRSSNSVAIGLAIGACLLVLISILLCAFYFSCKKRQSQLKRQSIRCQICGRRHTALRGRQQCRNAARPRHGQDRHLRQEDAFYYHHHHHRHHLNDPEVAHVVETDDEDDTHLGHGRRRRHHHHHHHHERGRTHRRGRRDRVDPWWWLLGGRPVPPQPRDEVQAPQQPQAGMPQMRVPTEMDAPQDDVFLAAIPEQRVDDTGEGAAQRNLEELFASHLQGQQIRKALARGMRLRGGGRDERRTRRRDRERADRVRHMRKRVWGMGGSGRGHGRGRGRRC